MAYLMAKKKLSKKETDNHKTVAEICGFLMQ